MKYSVKDFAYNLNYWIEERKTTPQWLADASYISRNTIKNYLRNSYSPSADTVCRIADVLEITPNALLVEREENAQ